MEKEDKAGPKEVRRSKLTPPYLQRRHLHDRGKDTHKLQLPQCLELNEGGEGGEHLEDGGAQVTVRLAASHQSPDGHPKQGNEWAKQLNSEAVEALGRVGRMREGEKHTHKLME